MDTLVRLDLSEVLDKAVDRLVAQLQKQGKKDPTGLAEQLLDHAVRERVLATVHATDNYETDPRYSSVFRRGMNILAIYTASNRPLGVVEVARMVKVGPSTTHRFVTTLVADGYLRQIADSRKYELAVRPTTRSAVESTR